MNLFTLLQKETYILAILNLFSHTKSQLSQNRIKLMSGSFAGNKQIQPTNKQNKETESQTEPIQHF